VVDRLAVAGNPELRALLLYARGRRDPFSAADAADALGVHHNVARRRLDRLVDAGFLVVTRERRSGRSGPGAGRPAKVYRAAPELEGIEFPDRRLADLVGLLVGRVPARVRPRALRGAGEDFGCLLAAATELKPSRNARVGLANLCEALGTLGFQASVVSVTDRRGILESPTCPLRPLVVKRPETDVIDRGMWAGLVERAVDGVRATRVTCDTSRCLSEGVPCRIRVSLETRAEMRSSRAEL
jgi:predicted ArsR family transcriptional regulator